MIGIVIVAHGGLAREYLAAMEHVVGRQPGVTAISIGPEDSCRNKQTDIDAAVAGVDTGDGVVVVTDMFGSTPSNLAMGACKKANHKVLYGVNLPLLIKLAKARGMPIDEAIVSALTAGRKYINSIDGFGEDWTPIAL
ncbi:MAG TPA: PTS fructose transporter subunit IIA [Amaricoccus sp.]|uniref:PTS sugar transporter subunit IIA n=1 Tax=Amaricoccus sp. TaxID=1872485 RepID=UPI002C07AC61|nr:PTS fructose transporter subunit IIA [Amaricoccus sp.]HMQ94205.1 PTS fructose transporter subunit IIA [Amaricoccus sp.]HMR53226.1 PTS fructose transporter subunit IIA [Amaricoccus sp.]HMR61261.1 PTS fructose transporter subunit IIA [Amaricoccus sp.]HMU00159.1 PTS fructose transporter subunit IIA [Amaricoccus sp.]